MNLDRRHTTWASSDRFVPRTFVRPVLRFIEIEAASGVLLLAAAVVAIAWANSPWNEGYVALFEEMRLLLSFGPIEIDETFGHFINDGLMVIFFFVVGLEIKREMVQGDLADPRSAALPAMAALGGMVIPALIYVIVTAGLGGDALRGWGIPMATDIAFAVGLVSLLGRRVPPGGKLFLLALAIADDIGAIVVIALFYTGDTQLGWLGAAVAGLVVVWVAQRVGIRSYVFYIPAAVVVWYATFRSGVHATLAGVALAFLTPTRALYSSEEFDIKARRILDTYPAGSTDEDEERADHEAALLTEIAIETRSPLDRLGTRLHPWSSFVILPLFALANAGVSFAGTDFDAAAPVRVALGVALGLLVGKMIGITAFTWLAVKTGLGRLPPAVTWTQVVGLAAAAGIGFTVSLFVTGLAFTDPTLADAARVGVLAGSIVAGGVGAVFLFAGSRR